MVMRRRTALLAAMILGGLTWAGMPAQAGDWKPVRPIRIVVPFGPGGATDVITRILASHMQETLGQSLIIENRPGAGGVIANAAVKESPADGYTLLVTTIGFGANPALFRDKKLPFDPTNDFTFISQTVVVPCILAVHPSLNIKTAQEFIDLAKKKPGTLMMGSAGYGTVNHLASELLQAEAGIKTVHVAYRSGGASTTALLTGEISGLFATAPTALEFIKTGQFVPLATSGTAKLPALPDLPPLSATVPGFDVVEWQGIVGPPGLPPEITSTIHKAVLAALKDPKILDRLKVLGAEPVGSSPEDFKKFVEAEVAKWHGVADRTGMKAKD